MPRSARPHARDDSRRLPPPASSVPPMLTPEQERLNGVLNEGERVILAGEQLGSDSYQDEEQQLADRLERHGDSPWPANDLARRILGRAT